MRILSWNVNGLRAVLGKGFAEFLEEDAPEILCLQEIKARPDQVEWRPPEEYECFWNPAEKPGYSGTLIITKVVPLRVSYGLGTLLEDLEGRVITAEYDQFFLVNVYTPNAKGDLSRLSYRTEIWDPAFRAHLCALKKTKPVLFCGDLNVAHEEIDLANPKTNRKNAGFTDEERGAFSDHLEAGFIDSFRLLHPSTTGAYSWWSYRAGARKRNVGWRIDYVGLSEDLSSSVEEAWIQPEVMGSDHCPVGVKISGLRG